MNEFLWSVRVYYEDTDSGGVVYHTNYLKYMERARTEWLRAMGFEQDCLRQEFNILFAVHSIKTEFLKPARFNQLLSVSVKIVETGKASIRFLQKITIQSEPDTDLIISEVRIACIDADQFKVRPIPEQVLEEIKRD